MDPRVGFKRYQETITNAPADSSEHLFKRPYCDKRFEGKKLLQLMADLWVSADVQVTIDQHIATLARAFIGRMSLENFSAPSAFYERNRAVSRDAFFRHLVSKIEEKVEAFAPAHIQSLAYTRRRIIIEDLLKGTIEEEYELFNSYSPSYLRALEIDANQAEIGRHIMQHLQEWKESSPDCLEGYFGYLKEPNREQHFSFQNHLQEESFPPSVKQVLMQLFSLPFPDRLLVVKAVKDLLQLHVNRDRYTGAQPMSLDEL